MISFVSCSVVALALVACADDDNEVKPPKDGGTDSTIAPFDSAAQDAGSDANADAAPTATNVVSFEINPDAGKFELPEAISFKDNAAYVSLVASAEITKIAYPSGARTTFAKLPVTATNFTLGNAFDKDGNLYVAVAVGSNPADLPSLAAAGVYKIPANSDGGTTATLWASSPTKLKFPNGLSFDPAGNLYVTDAAEGAIYKFPPAGAVGTATEWKKDPLLAGDMAACPGTVQAFPLGANGIHAEADAVWAVNTDKGTLVKVAVDGTGAAGAATEAVKDCAKLEGVDGMRPDPRAPTATFIATNNAQNAIVAIGRTGGVTTLLQGKPPFYSPADLAHVTGTSKPTDFLVVNASFAEAFAPPDAGAGAPKPSMVKLSLP